MSERGTEEVEARRAGILEMFERDYPELMDILRGLRADRYRLDWIEKHEASIEGDVPGVWSVVWTAAPNLYKRTDGFRSPRAAIDAAMSHP